MSDITPQTGKAIRGQPRRTKGVNRSFAMFRAVTALILREMATRYGRSPGGYIWAVLEPLGMILALAIAFSVLIRVPPMGNSFILFFATGFLPFQLYNSISDSVARSINFSRALLFYPAVTWVDAALGRLILNFFTDVLVMLLLFLMFVTLTDVTLFLDIGPVIAAVLLAAALGFGIGLFNCVVFGFFPVWMNIWGIANRPMFFISGILFVFENMPDYIQTYLWYNPLVHIIGLMREGFYPSYEAHYASPAYVMTIAGLLIFFGALLMRRFHREILNR